MLVDREREYEKYEHARKKGANVKCPLCGGTIAKRPTGKAFQCVACNKKFEYITVHRNGRIIGWHEDVSDWEEPDNG